MLTHPLPHPLPLAAGFNNTPAVVRATDEETSSDVFLFLYSSVFIRSGSEEPFYLLIMSLFKRREEDKTHLHVSGVPVRRNN